MTATLPQTNHRGSNRSIESMESSKFDPTAHCRIVSLILALFVLLLSALQGAGSDYVLVVDVSGSMTNRVSKTDKRVRITVVQDALKQYLPSLPNNSRVKLIAFSSGIVSEKELMLCGEAEVAQSLAWVNALEKEARKNHDTHLFTTIRYALQTAANYSKQNPDQPVTVRVLTDGEDSQNTTTLDKVLGEFKQLLDGERIRGNLVILGDFEFKTKLALPQGFVVRKDPEWVELFPPAILMVPPSPKVDEEVRFIENGKSAYKDYEWSVDGRLVSREKVLTWKFTAAGNHQVLLKVSAGLSAKNSAAVKVTVFEREKPVVEQLVADFVAHAVRVQPMEEVAFTARCAGQPVKFSWSVNGKEVATTADYVHRFEQEGQHAVKLTVANAAGNAASRSQTILVTEPGLTVAIKGPSEIASGRVVQFASEIQGPCARVEWQFGGGLSSKERNPQHTFTCTNGEYRDYPVAMRAFTPLGKVVEAKPHVLRVLAEKITPAPIAAFRIMNAEPKTGDALQLVDESRGIVESYAWEVIGEGRSGERNPAMKVSVPGLKTVRLRVKGPGGYSETNRTVTVLPRYTPVSATITASTKSGVAPLTVRFGSKLVGDATGLHWTFGDGTTSSEPSPVHTYQQATNFVAMLTVNPVDPEQAAVESKLTIQVSEPRPAWVSPAAYVGCILLLAAIVGALLYRRHQAALRLSVYYWPEDSLTCRTVVLTRPNEIVELTPHVPLRVKREGRMNLTIEPCAGATLMASDGREVATQRLGQGTRALVKSATQVVKAVAIAPGRKPSRPVPAEPAASPIEADATASAAGAADWSW